MGRPASTTVSAITVLDWISLGSLAVVWGFMPFTAWRWRRLAFEATAIGQEAVQQTKQSQDKLFEEREQWVQLAEAVAATVVEARRTGTASMPLRLPTLPEPDAQRLTAAMRRAVDCVVDGPPPPGATC